MIGVDTSVILRLLVKDDERQPEIATRYLNRHCSSQEPGLIADIVFVECAWVLGYFYDYSRVQIGEAIDALLGTAQLRAENASGVSTALQRSG